MLNKKVCKKCKGSGWSELSEKLWKSGFVRCPSFRLPPGVIVRSNVSRVDCVSEFCTYQLEQEVSQGC